MADQRLRVILELVDKLSPGMKNAGASVNKFSTEANTGNAAVSALDKALATAGVVGVLLFARKIAQATLDLALFGAEAARVGDSLNRVASAAGQSGEEIAAAMNEAVRGTIDDEAMMQAATKGMIMGLKLTGEQWAELAAGVKYHARLIGADAEQMFAQVVDAITRGQPRMLTALSFPGARDAINEVADALDGSASSMTEAERQAALAALTFKILRGEMGQFGDMAPDVIDATDRLAVSFDNLKESVGEKVAPGLTETFTGLNNLITMDFGPFLTGLERSAKEGNILDKALLTVIMRSPALRDALLGVSTATDKATTAAIGASPVWYAVGLAIREAGKEAQKASPFWNTIGKLVKYAGDQAKQAALSLSYAEALETSKRAAADSMRWTAIAAQYKEDAETEAATASADAWTDAYDEMQQAAQQFQSDVEGLFQFTMSINATDVLDSMGFHKDTWDEWMRRAADVMNQGTASPWYQQMMAAFPKFADLVAQFGDPKVAAAEFIRQFQLGFVPEAINIDAIVAAYKEQLSSKEAWAGIYEAAKQAIIAAGGTVDETVLGQLVGVDKEGEVVNSLTTTADSVNDITGDINGVKAAADKVMPDVAKSFEKARDRTKEWHDQLLLVLGDLASFVGLGFQVSITPTSQAVGGATGTGTGTGTGTNTGTGTGTGTGGTGGGNGTNIQMQVSMDESFRAAMMRAGLHPT